MKRDMTGGGESKYKKAKRGKRVGNRISKEENVL